MSFTCLGAGERYTKIGSKVNNNNNNNNPLFILGYTISIASLHHGPVPYTKIKRMYIQDKTNC